ncbi:MAG: hypothetical protein KIT83_18615 [Bryobacterales bacterium]|nr:hypothetical protein [Bryobacterales bacterium]
MTPITRVALLALVSLVGLCLFAQSYRYDNSSRLVRVVQPDGNGITYVYDDNDNLMSAFSITAPAMPITVSSTRSAPDQARVTWSGVTGASGYRVERRVEGSSRWEVAGTVGSGALTFVDNNLQPGVRYEYRIAATTPGGDTGAYTAASLAPLFGTPHVYPQGIVNGASFEQGQPISRGSIISLFGSPLGFTIEGSTLAPFEAAAEAIPLPRTLNGVTVLIGGFDAPLFYVGGQPPTQGAGGSLIYNGQINAQVPWEVPEAGLVEVIVRAETANGILESEPVEVPMAPLTPAIFTFDFGPGRAAALNVKLRADDGVIDASVAQPEGAFPGRDSQPAPIGGVITIYCNGLGATTPPARTGENSEDLLRRTAASAKVFIGGVEAPVDFAGLAPQFVGLYQINAFIPQGVVPGPQVPIVIEQNGVRSRGDVTIAVRLP